MELDHSFRVPADLDTVWQAALDPERVAPCMPGATLTEVAGSTFSGTVKVKLGPISLLYKGSGEFLETDEAARRFVIKASGKDSRGNGTAAATVTVSLRADGDGTAGTVHTDLSITGKPAQFGRGMISEVGGKILDAFATCLAKELAPAEEAAETRADAASTKETQSDNGKAAAKPAVKSAKPAEAGEPASEAAPAATPKPTAGPSPSPAATEAEPAATERRPQLTVVEEPAGNGVAEPKPRPARQPAATEPETEPIDLLAYAGPSVLKRAAPLIALLVAILVIVALRRRSR